MHDNEIYENTDVDLMVGGGTNGLMEYNVIWQSSQRAFAGLMVGWFDSGAGDHSGTTYQYNEITAYNDDKLAFGIMVGSEPWYYYNRFVTHAGSVVNNSVDGAVVELAIDGIGDGYIMDNTLGTPLGTLAFYTCSLPYGLEYTAHMFGAATIQANPDNWWFFEGNCGAWSGGFHPDDSFALARDEWLSASDVIDSANGNYHLVYQTDGNLVLYNYNWTTALWSTGTQSSPGMAVMQTDGNFVVYDDQWGVKYNTGTPGNRGAYLVVTNAGAVLLISISGGLLYTLHS
jgi:hypothetical protein